MDTTVRTGQRISSGSWSPTSAHDTPESHGLTTLLDFKSLIMAEAADLMETYTTPATTNEEQAERRMKVHLICLPAYPEWEHDTNPISAPAKHDATRDGKTARNDNTALHTAPTSITAASGGGDAHVDKMATPRTMTTQPQSRQHHKRRLITTASWPQRPAPVTSARRQLSP